MTHTGFKLIPPPSDLSKHIRFLYTLRSQPNFGDRYIFRTMATGYPTLFFSYRGTINEQKLDSTSRSSVTAGIFGASDNSSRFKLSADFAMIGVCLYPTALERILKLPGSELTNQFVSLSEVDKSEFNCIQDRVAECTNEKSALKVITSFVRTRLQTTSDANNVDQALARILTSKGNASINQLSDDFCRSRRTFERQFKQHSGLSPKSYSNIVRFQSTFNHLTSSQLSLTEIGYECGYYDQSHFTNDFKKYSGFSPKFFTCNDPSKDPLWRNFVAFFQFISWCPPVLCNR